jgi:hypothetical protein
MRGSVVVSQVAGAWETVSYDVERRIPGVDAWRAAVRRRALLAYADTSALMRTIQYEHETSSRRIGRPVASIADRDSRVR